MVGGEVVRSSSAIIAKAQYYKRRFLYHNLHHFEYGKRKVQKYLYLWRHKLQQIVYLSSVAVSIIPFP